MDEISLLKDGDPTRLQGFVAPSKAELSNPKCEAINRKKRRRGKFKRKLVKPFVKVPWQDKRKNDKNKRNNRFRKIVLAKTQAPFNNNQFLMEIHKPEPENSFDILQTPSARTRDSSFSIDSEDNYFYSLPEDEEEYLTKEFSSVYEDAQSERLSNMSKCELIQEYLLLEAKYDNLLKRTERSKQKPIDENILTADRETAVRDNMIDDRDASAISNESSVEDELSYSDLLQRLKEQDEQLSELQLTNEKLRLENEHLHQRPQGSSSEDSESDSSSSSDSDSSSSASLVDAPIEMCDEAISNEVQENGESHNVIETSIINGFHSPSEET